MNQTRSYAANVESTEVVDEIPKTSVGKTDK